MLPTRIKIHNLGAIPEAEIDLTGIFCASILGANGAGKSTFFTWAVNYALYGKTKNNCSVDDMVRKGTTDMWVQLEFEHNNEVYQVTRGRSIKSKQGKSSCELQKRTSTGWESLTEAKIADTDKKIEQLLSLDYNTFISSSMILQNDSGRFAQSLPSERKIVLSQILGLDIYSTLQEKAKDRAKALELKLEASKQELASLEEKLKALPEVEAKLAEVKKSLTLVACDIREKESELADIQAQIKDLEAKQQEAERIEKQIETLSQEIKAREDEIKALNVKITDAETILKSEPEIMAAVTDLEAIKAQIPALQAKEANLNKLRNDRENVGLDLENLLDSQKLLTAKSDKLKKDLSLRDELKQSAEQYQQGLKELKTFDAKAEQYQALTAKINTAETDLLKASTSLDSLLNEYSQLEKKVAILENSGCIDSAVANCRFLKDAQDAQAKMPELKQKVEDARLAMNPLSDTRDKLKAEREALTYDSAYHTDIKNKLESLRQKAEQYAQLSSKEELLQNLNEQRQNLSQRITALDEQRISLNAEIKALEAETESLPILKAKIPSLEVYVKQRDKLPEAKAIIQSAREQIHKLDVEAMTKEDQILALKGNIGDLLISSAVNPEEGFTPIIQFTKHSEQLRQVELKELQCDQNRLFASQGALTNQLDTLILDMQKRDSLGQELAPQAKDLTRWQTLVKAFGKNGVPALVIENCIPELERIVNDILSQMTNGQNSLRFDTQRDKKDGKGTIEVLDIWVNDDSGYERIYETFSGGEALRIDLAIRLGLAELLANRAGSKIEWICADEIFGSQDKEHTELVIQALKAIAPRFKKILVITHIESTQTAFDQRIILSEGGRVEIQFN